MQHFLLLAILAFSLPVAHAGGGPIDSGQAKPDAAPSDLADPERIKKGKFLFHSTCADHCHGHVPALFVGRKDLDPEHAFNTISKGGQGATPMPPWGDIFSVDEIWSLVAYLKSLGQP